jgi:hypothetical protein
LDYVDPVVRGKVLMVAFRSSELDEARKLVQTFEAHHSDFTE